jgi:C4-type Zn-finger protein
MKCPDCGTFMTGHEYAYNDPNHYDGVSEWHCESCNIRIGRWSRKRLTEDEVEPRFGGR